MTKKTHPKKSFSGISKDVQNKSPIKKKHAPKQRWTDETLRQALLETQKDLAAYEQGLSEEETAVMIPNQASTSLTSTENIQPFTHINTGTEKITLSRQEALEAIINELDEGNETEAMQEEAPLQTSQYDENIMKQIIDFLIKENPITKSKKQAPVTPTTQTKDVIPLWELLSFRNRNRPMDNIEKTMMLADIRRGLEAREFLYLYQPQWNIENGKLETVVSSLRWRHPKKGMLGSDFFIILFEEAGLIRDLLNILIEQVLIDRSQLELNGLTDIKMTIKLTPEQLELDYLSDEILGLLDKMNINPNMIECELTERQFPKCPRQMRANLQNFQNAGMGLSLDNFGTGFSAYPYLLEFPFNKIKLDKSYINHIFQNPRGQLISRAVINLAHLLQAQAVIDGIDNPEVLHWLRMAGCDCGQGCYLGGPMMIEDLIDFLKEYRTIAQNGIQEIEKFWQRHAKHAEQLSPDC